MHDSDAREDFFDKVFGDQQQAAINVVRQLAFEERVIKRVFTDCGQKPAGWGRLANLCRAATGEVKLNFAWFNSEFSRFPGVLCGKRIPYMHKIALLDLFKLKNKNRLVRAISKELNTQEINEARPFVFAFTIVKTLFVAHNLDLAPHPEVEFSAEVRFHTFARPLIVEPAKIAFAKIGAEWCTE